MIKSGLFTLLTTFLLLAAFYYPNLTRLYYVVTLFEEDKIVDNFRSMDQRGFPMNVAQRGEGIALLKPDPRALPEYFTYKGEKISMQQFLKDKWTTGLVVLKVDSTTEARLLFEDYYLGNSKDSKVMSWSMGKSVVSALVGIALAEGKIESIHDPVTKYVPLLKKSGYNNVKIKDVLQMSSGVRFGEDYFDFWSDINVMGRTLALGYNFDDFIASLWSEREAGTKLNYISVDTQVLGMLLKAVLGGQTVTNYLQEKIWKLGGFECDLFWLLDNEHHQMELAFGTLNTCTRDYARFGWLYLNKGKSPLDGRQLVNEAWINASIVASEPYLMPTAKRPLGYGYQFWLPASETDPTQTEGDYVALGVYNQFTYVSPKYNIVIAKNSAYAHYPKNAGVSEFLTIAALREIAKTLGAECKPSE